MFKEFKFSKLTYLSLAVVNGFIVGSNVDSNVNAFLVGTLTQLILAVPFTYYWIKKSK